MKASNLDYRDQSRALNVIGVILLIGGSASAILAPLEMYCFYLFSEGGRFYYEGFRFGSFMFGNIASQIIGYYLIAFLLMPLGYGHLKKRRWVRTLSLALLWSWLVVGAPLVILVFFILTGSKELSLPVALIALVFLGLSYLLFPGLLIRFYNGQNVRRTLESKDTRTYWLENVPMPILVLSYLYLFYVIVLHILILFNSIFPAFGTFRFGLQGIVLLDISIVCLICILWGTLRQQLWAWWVSVFWLGLFLLSTVLTFLKSSYLDLLDDLAFPASEVDFLDGIPAQGYHFSILVGIPLLITWLLLLQSKRHFKSGAGV